MQLHESMNVTLCLIEEGGWEKLGQRPDTYTIRAVSQEKGQVKETGSFLVKRPMFFPEAQRDNGGNNQVPRTPMGKMWNR